MASVDPDAAHKTGIAKQKKDAGDQAFKQGETMTALRAYHEALMYLVGLSKNVPGAVPTGPVNEPDPKKDEEKPKTEADELLEKVYANMAACHIKNSNWKRALECADKALAKNSKNNKALFRKAKALGELGFFERADKIFKELIEADPPDAAAIKAEHDRLRAIDKEREKKHNQKFRGFLNREKPEKATTTGPKIEGGDDSKRFEWIDEPEDAVSDD